MTPLLFAALALAGGLGAVCRLVLDGIIHKHTRGVLPWGTIVINISGSFLLSVLAGLAAGRLLPEAVFLVVGPGFLGGYTTFSTASFETFRIFQDGRRIAAAVNGVGALVVATASAGVGLWIGSLP